MQDEEMAYYYKWCQEEVGTLYQCVGSGSINKDEISYLLFVRVSYNYYTLISSDGSRFFQSKNSKDIYYTIKNGYNWSTSSHAFVWTFMPIQKIDSFERLITNPTFKILYGENK